MDASVVIPARNAEGVLVDQLRALARQDFAGEFETIVVDNGSTDRTRAVAEETFRAEDLPNARVVDASERSGVNYARNVGTQAARSDLVLICDADDVVSPQWVGEMVKSLGEFDAVGGVLETQSINPGSASMLLRNPDRAGVAFMMDFLPAPRGANCGYRKEAYEDVGGFSESYAGGGDENEFFWRLQLAGYTLGEAERAVVAYRLREDVRGALRQVYSYAKANPQLYRDFRGYGVPRSFRRMVGKWVWLIVRLPYLALSRRRRMIWLRAAAIRLGHLVGSVHQRVVYL